MLYYSGTSPTFSTATLFNTAVPANVGIDINFNGSQTLLEGTNYFWLVYDINDNATIGDFVDGVCTSTTIDGSIEIPTVTNPAGNRELITCTRICPSSSTVFFGAF